jgi:hypothetical protein
MSAVCILAPVVVAAWPAFSAAVTAAATSLGFTIVAEKISAKAASVTADAKQSVELSIENSELVTGQLGRDQRITVTRAGVTVTFSRDARGKASLCVTGTGHTDDALRAIGEELSGRVVQQYVYQRLMEELRTRHFNVVEEATDASHAIHLKVRHWEN